MVRGCMENIKTFLFVAIAFVGVSVVAGIDSAHAVYDPLKIKAVGSCARFFKGGTQVRSVPSTMTCKFRITGKNERYQQRIDYANEQGIPPEELFFLQVSKARGSTLLATIDTDSLDEFEVPMNAGESRVKVVAQLRVRGRFEVQS